MEYGPEIDISVLKIKMKSGLEKIILKFLHAKLFSNKWIYYIHRKAKSYKFSNKNDRFCASGNALERVQRVHEPADLWDITF